MALIRRWRKRRKKIVAGPVEVYGRPDLVAVLYKGDSFYTYLHRSHAR